jgi:LysR family transcriptional regulator of abg operon
MRLSQVRDFVAVVESGSIRAAARKLGVSQPAITKSVRSLESKLHVRLLQRTPQGIVLTPPGRAFFARTRVGYAELVKAEKEATQAGGEGTGSVAFGVGPTAGFLVIPEAIIRFREEFPKVTVRIAEGFAHLLVPLVRDGTLDFAIGARPDEKLDPAIAFRPLFRHDFVIVARKGHPLRNAQSLAELIKADWINFVFPDLRRGPLGRAFSTAGLPVPQHAIQCDSFHTAMGLLMRADVLVIVSRRMLAAPFARDVLHQITVAESLPSYTAGMFTRVDTPPTLVAASMEKAVTMVARKLNRSA